MMLSGACSIKIIFLCRLAHNEENDSAEATLRERPDSNINQSQSDELAFFVRQHTRSSDALRGLCTILITFVSLFGAFIFSISLQVHFCLSNDVVKSLFESRSRCYQLQASLLLSKLAYIYLYYCIEYT